MFRKALQQSISYTSIIVLNVAGLMVMGSAYITSLPEVPPEQLKAHSAALEKPPVPEKANVKSGVPVRVEAASVDVDQAVEIGDYNSADSTWTLGHDSAYYAKPTVPANDNSGTTMIYGHNVWSIFRNLHGLEQGDKLKVYTDNNLVFHYTFTGSRQVSPEDTSPLKNTKDPKMVLVTCSGIFSEHRTSFTFKFERVERA